MEVPRPAALPSPMTTALSSPLVDSRPQIPPSPEDLDPESPKVMAFRWLLLFGFPPADAAAAVRPDIFKNPGES